MAKTSVATVDAYLAVQPPATRAVLERVRAAIRKAVPAAQECISYQIPAYKLPGGTVIFFAGWKAFFSLYPATASLVEALADELAGRIVSKGTIRFPLNEKVPVGLVGRIAKLRAQEVRAVSRPGTRRTRR